jgi:ubiquinone/menaquinone biosynthesis C-methylase UbiE
VEKTWNLTADQWAAVLGSHDNPARVAEGLRQAGSFVPWSQVLVNETADCETTLDLGCGRGEHSAVLARHGRRPTLVDWSTNNLTFSRGLLHTSGARGRFCQADITRPLPFASKSIDAVFSCGVFEYFTASQIDHMLAEALRVARKRVIVLVPNAKSLAYRLGKWHMERTGAWVWGGEVPSHTLAPAFRRAGARRIREYTVAARHALAFLTMRGGPRVARLLTHALNLDDHARPARLRQGYLLVTVGDAAAVHERGWS